MSQDDWLKDILNDDLRDFFSKNGKHDERHIIFGDDATVTHTKKNIRRPRYAAGVSYVTVGEFKEHRGPNGSLEANLTYRSTGDYKLLTVKMVNAILKQYHNLRGEVDAIVLCSRFHFDEIEKVLTSKEVKDKEEILDMVYIVSALRADFIGGRMPLSYRDWCYKQMVGEYTKLRMKGF